jgi:hypothetical protein
LSCAEINWQRPLIWEPLKIAVLYATIGGLIAWLLVDILLHVHVAISWR